jgi:hypothetical protein
MDTAYYREKCPASMVDLIDKYNLQIRLDDFGMGKEIYLERMLLGYWFESVSGIFFHETVDFGRGQSESRTYDNWDEFCADLDKRITEFKRGDMR